MMEYQPSLYGEKLGSNSGILELMDDLGQAMAQGGMLMMGGGNPAIIPEVVDTFRHRMREITESSLFDQMVGYYEPPQGNPQTIAALAGLLKEHCGWEVAADNIAVTGGGQSAFFHLFNLLAGENASGKTRKILFPLTPEYIGYADQAVASDLLTARPSIVKESTDGFFKYHIDFDRLQIDESIAAICVSRPTNPTGNVLTDDEMSQLSSLAEQHGIPPHCRQRLWRPLS